jgi:group II intron reverse transcriptase/maturase
MKETSSSLTISTKLERIAKLAKEVPGPLTTLAHCIDVEWLREAYRRTRKDGATGIDGTTAEEYAKQLESNLESLINRAKAGDKYRAPPVRRVHIPKGDGRTRPIGIPTFEDKILQRAVAMVIEAVYEPSFYDFSYGFRPGRSAHQALQAIWDGTMSMQGGWVLEADIESFFDSVPHDKLRDVLGQRVRDGVLLRLIGKWLNAGVFEQGCIYHPEFGTPQGGVISPLLANIYLHEVIDDWFVKDVQPRLSGRSMLVRYADDLVLVFTHEADAKRVLAALSKRFEKYGLRLHPEKTRIIPFRRPPNDPRSGREGDVRNGTFDFLGFTHFWRRSRKGFWVVMRKTMSSRLSRALRRISDWCRTYRHLPISQQRDALSRKLRGHDAYYGITGNSPSVSAFHFWAESIWAKWLNRRSQRKRNWDEMKTLLRRFRLAPPRMVHSSLRA